MQGSKPQPLFSLGKKAIFSPLADFALTSGISLLVMLGLLIYYMFWHQDTNVQAADILPKLLILQVLLNWPHFMVSYRLLYYKKENFKEFPFATLVVPVALLVVCFGATLPVFGGMGFFAVNLKVAYVLWMFSALYLAWHYTGQAWGMMSVYAHLSGIKFSKQEVFILRGGLRALILWHVIWALPTLPQVSIIGILQHPTTQVFVNSLVILSFVAGCVVFALKSRRHALDIRIIGAWLVTYVWYLVLYLMPEAFAFIQISHAMQYLIFPARVELNRDRHKANYKALKAKVRVVLLYSIAVAGGLVIFYLPDLFLTSSTNTPTFAALIAIAINIHHYYTDSAIWKMRNGGVRQSLLNHLR
jgi:hypothetical protein